MKWADLTREYELLPDFCCWIRSVFAGVALPPAVHPERHAYRSNLSQKDRFHDLHQSIDTVWSWRRQKQATASSKITLSIFWKTQKENSVFIWKARLSQRPSSRVEVDTGPSAHSSFPLFLQNHHPRFGRWTVLLFLFCSLLTTQTSLTLHPYSPIDTHSYYDWKSCHK